MTSQYEPPEVITYGDIRVITQQGGSSRTDVPIGTPVDADTPISDVAS